MRYMKELYHKNKENMLLIWKIMKARQKFYMWVQVYGLTVSIE